MRKLIVLIFSFSLLSACSNQSLYYWNGYEDQLYDYHQDKPPSELIDKLEKIKARSQSQEKPLPPSFYAHLGFLYQKAGQTEKFKELAREEKKQYPESTSFMDFLLKRGG